MPDKSTSPISPGGYYFLAIDGDGTLWETDWPNIGEPRLDIICRLDARIKYLESQGYTVIVILWTCREDIPEGDYLTQAVQWCKEHNIPISDGCINTNPYYNFGHPELVRKIFANEYWDDKAVRC